MSTIKRNYGLLVLLIALIGGSFGYRAMASDESPTRPQWNKETIDLLATLPVQHNGRVKPLETLAGLNMLMVNGRRKLELDEDTKIKPTAWMLDCFFFPERAKEYRAFRIENDAVLTAIGVEARKKRDWYSYNEIAPAQMRLSSEAQRASQVDTAKRGPVDRQLLKLHQDLRSFQSLVEFLDPVRETFPTGTTDSLVAIFGERETSSLSMVVQKMGQLRELGSSISQTSGDEYEAIGGLLRKLDSTLGKAGSGPTIFPPHPGAANPEEWWTIGDLLIAGFSSDEDFSSQNELLASWERLESKKSDPVAFHAELTQLHSSLVGQTAERGEYKHIPLEVQLGRRDPFTNALVFYLLGFLLLAGTWLAPKSNALRKAVWGSITIGTVLLIAGIVVRCIIRERPPVVTLYDTILFITAVVVIVALIMEWLTR
ncbi:MAG: hypothetical protein ACI841_005304, partial [Planctomycetota bacterium]